MEAYNKIIKPIKNESPRSVFHIITFNYTNTIERLLSVIGPNPDLVLDKDHGYYLQDICHVHGQLGDTIIIKYFCRKYCDVIRCLMTHKICSMYKRGECQIIKSRLEEPRKLMIIRNHTTKC